MHDLLMFFVGFPFSVPCLPPFLGGGSQRLFRKVGSKSSIYSTESSVRSAGSYIYEDFMPTDGTDVKVPTYLRCSNVYKEASINQVDRFWDLF